MANRNRKLQVFVSSTFIDLQEERQAAVQAILNAGHIPAGMELFIASDESQWEIIQEWIQESDIYMLIIGGRYGSIEPKTGKTYTHLEYEYALSLDKPHFVIVIDDETTQKKAKKDGVKITDVFDNSPQLKEFKISITGGKLVHPCENLDKIESSVLKSIYKLSQREGLKGWIRDEGIDNGLISEELARLAKENSELKLELANYQNSGEKINGIDIKEFALFLKNKKVGGLTFQYNDRDEYKDIKNLLSFFQYLTVEYKERSGSFIDENGEYTSGLWIIKSYSLIEKDKLRFTEVGIKLMVYLEMNPYLLD